MSKNGTAVSLRGVTKCYETGTSRVQALRGVELEVRLGELLMLVGPSGCGKTTLISVVAAILDHDDGEIVVFDRSLKAMSPAEKTRFRGANIGFVFQAYNLIPTISITENVAIPLLILGRRRADAMARAAEMLAAVGLGDKLEVFPAQLSGGQQQRVAIARALAADPTLIVADEPTGDLDRVSAEEVLVLMERLCRELGKTIIMVTHDPRAARRAARIKHLDKGVLTDDLEAPLPECV